WNPLSYVTSVTRAQELTDAFVGAYTDPSTRTDAYFEPEGHNLVSNLLLAAALADRPITDVYLWTLDPNQMLVAAAVLRDRGQDLAAASLDSQATLPGDQRGGVFGTAKKILGFLENPDVCRWIVGSRSDARPQLDLPAFVQSSGDTLYLHSKEGKGSSAGVVTALAMALCDAAEQHAKRSPGGRLAVPLVGVLDEAANICRWPQLPNLYSHYGSRGICLLTLLQGWSQGREVWGEAGIEKLWTAANVKCYGGGSDEDQYLAKLERLVGDYDRLTVSVSDRRDGRSTSRQSTRTAIQTVADLRALPRDRLIMFASGTPPVWARPLYWWESPAAGDIRQSLRLFDPAEQQR
ncbi:MAG: type IV secretory system conjugative DNA transfer family protein, partial [Solirubrobacteraceae bacterium]